MKIPKAKAIELIDVKIKQFEDLAKNATFDNRYKEDYKLAYEGTEILITELFSEEETKKFRMKVTRPAIGFVGRIDYAGELQHYKEHISECIAQLKAHKERIENFWSDKIKKTAKKTVVPFVSMSFKKVDKDINEYIKGILEALKIKFKTGERYSKKSIPKKVKNRIRTSDLLISIFVKRDKLAKDGYTTPAWLIKELTFAQATGKGIIPLIERGIKDIASLEYEKEVIYFVRDDVEEMEEATIKFLEALKEHKLI